MPVACVDRGEEREHHGPRRRGHRDVLALIRVRPRQRASADAGAAARRMLAGQHRAGGAARREHEGEAPPGQRRLAVPRPGVPGVARIPGRPGAVGACVALGREWGSTGIATAGPGSRPGPAAAGCTEGTGHAGTASRPAVPPSRIRRAARRSSGGRPGPWPGTARSTGLSSAGTCPSDGLPWTTRYSSAGAGAVPNGGRPEAANASTPPRLKMSAAGPTSRPAACSGDMKPGEPSTRPLRTQPGRIRGAGDAEVDDPRPVDGEQHVRRLEVAVHDARRVHRAEAACQRRLPACAPR